MYLLIKGLHLHGFYYFIILLLSIIKRKKIKISLIKFLIPLFLIMNITFLTDIWDEEMKKNIVNYYNNSTLIKGIEEKEITAYNMSRQVILYVENNKKVASVFLFNFKKFHYDDENKWKEVD